MLSYNLALFTQGTAIMYLFIASSYFIVHRKERLKGLVGFILLFWLLQHVQDLIPILFNMTLTTADMHMAAIIDMTAVPTCTFILIELIRPGWVTWKRIAYHEFPFVLLIIIFALTSSDVVYHISLIFVFLYSFSVAIFLIKNIPLYHRSLKEQYSFTENLDVRWLWNILIFFMIFLGIWAYSFMASDIWIDVFYYVGSSLIWMTICYFISKHQIALKLTSDSEILNKVSLPIAEHAEVEQRQQYNFANSLYKLFEDDKLYLNPKLTLSDVSQELCTNRTYLSEYINNVLNTCFFDFVNEYRLEHASKLLKSEPALTLEQIAEESGFNSLSTFRRSFSKKYECTPHNYRKQQKDISIEP
ncbi:MAG: helix-turn-helix domain-containing protein [Muribaculaceae bacterium]